MKTADMTIGQDYAYDRNCTSWWNSTPSRVTLLATKVNAKDFYYSQQMPRWGMTDERRAELRAKHEVIRQEFVAKHGLPDLPVVVEDEMPSGIAITGIRYNSDRQPEPVIRLVNARYLTQPWDQYEADKREADEAKERARIYREQQEAEKAAADAKRKEEQAQWTRDFPEVGEALASIGLTVPQGIDGLALTPEQAKTLAQFIRANTTALRVA